MIHNIYIHKYILELIILLNISYVTDSRMLSSVSLLEGEKKKEFMIIVIIIADNK